MVEHLKKTEKGIFISQIQSKILYSNIYPTRCNITQFILSGNCFTCFGWHHHPSSGAHATVYTASGICHTVMGGVKFTDKVYIKIRLKLQLLLITRFCGNFNLICIGVYFISKFNSIHYGVTNTRCCRHNCLRS
jgi:hypothetical protein